MKKNSYFSSGFTLIELIIVIAIVVMATGLGLAGYNRFNQKQILTQAALEVRSNLRDAQNRAFTGEKDATCTAPLDYWVFKVLSTSSYKIFGHCGTIDFRTKIITLVSGLAISSPGEIQFKPLTQGTTLQTITITNTNGATGQQSIIITINPSGEITMGDIH